MIFGRVRLTSGASDHSWPASARQGNEQAQRFHWQESYDREARLSAELIAHASGVNLEGGVQGGGRVCANPEVEARCVLHPTPFGGAPVAQFFIA
jgi:hypothetical protein